MSLESAQSLIEKMKSDEAFYESIFADAKVENRLAKAKAAGFECSLDDMKQLQTLLSIPQLPIDGLPLTWQAGGPCHTKCAPIVA